MKMACGVAGENQKRALWRSARAARTNSRRHRTWLQQTGGKSGGRLKAGWRNENVGIWLVKKMAKPEEGAVHQPGGNLSATACR